MHVVKFHANWMKGGAIRRQKPPQNGFLLRQRVAFQCHATKILQASKIFEEIAK